MAATLRKEIKTNNRQVTLLIIIGLLSLVSVASAGLYPLPGAATNITYDSFDTTVTGCTGGGQSVQIWYGLSAGSYPKHVTVFAADTTWLVHVDVVSGYEGKVIYYEAIDQTLGVGSARFDALLSYPPSITTGAATGVTSNGFNVSVNGITGSEVWIEFGGNPGILNWETPVYDVAGTNQTIEVIGSPLYGGEHVYYRACDSSGCGSELSTILSEVTVVPTIPAARQLWRNVTRSRFAPTTLGASLLGVYTQVAPLMIVVGFAAMMYFIGLWMRTKTARTAAMMGIIFATFLASSSAGLMLGLPVVWSAIAGGVLALAFTGALWTLIHR